MCKIGYIASDLPKSRDISRSLEALGCINVAERSLHAIDILVVIGGDGFMLRTLHNYVIENRNVPVYGINTGNVGFLMNNHFPLNEDLINQIKNSVPAQLNLLSMYAIDIYGKKYKHIAVNEVYLFRKTNQIVEMNITINNTLKMEKLRGDGIIVSTPIGSTAYNLSAGGSVLPLNSNLMILTPINSYSPKSWKGALISSDTVVQLDIHNVERRPVVVVADYKEFHNISQVKIQKDSSNVITLLFDRKYSLNERIFDKQFLSH